MAINDSHDFFVQWHLTERCNLSCSHCYQSGNRTGELTFVEIQGVIREASDMLKAWEDLYDIGFSASFNITGGEPFLREDLFDVLEEIRGRDFDIYLLSNGTLINGERARRLADLGVKGVQVSIEGPESVHDIIRGKGSFSASLKGISHLLAAGLKVTLNATLSEINAASFGEMVDLATSLGAQRLGFSRLVPSGRGADLLDKMLEGGKVREIYEAIFSMKKEGLDIVTGDPVASQMSAPAPDDNASGFPTGGCAAGISGLTIMPEGTITPCRRLPIPIGNVRTDRLREVWAVSPVLESLRDKSAYRGKCGSCRRWTNCRGCRAIAYAYSLSKGEADFLADDPQCFIEN